MIPLGILAAASSISGGGGDASAYDAAVMVDSPWAYWKLDETEGTAMADVVGGRTATALGGVLIGQPGLVGGGRSIQCDGADDRCLTAYSSGITTAFNGDKAFTLEAVLKIGAVGADQRALHVGNYSSGSAQGFDIGISAAGAIRLALYVGGFRGVFTAADFVEVGEVYHVMATRAVGGACKLYVNGVEEGSGSWAGNVNVGSDPSFGGVKISIGASNGGAGSGNPAGFFTGNIARPAIYASALSAARALAHAQAAGLA